MSTYHLSDEEWIATWKECGSAVVMATKIGVSQRSVYNRRRSIEARHKIQLPSVDDQRFDQLKKIAQTTGHTRRGMDIEKAESSSLVMHTSGLTIPPQPLKPS